MEKTTCKFCGRSMNDLTHGTGSGRNFICQCGAHLYSPMISFFKNQKKPVQWFSPTQWANFVETGIISENSVNEL